MDSTNAKFDRRNFLKAGAAVAGVAGFPAIVRGQGAKIKVGLMLPYTGTFAPLGVAIENGFRLALQEAGGKFAGREVEFIKVDDESEPSKATDNINRLVTRDKVDLVLGTQKFHRAAGYIDDLLAGRRDQVVDTDEEPGSQSAIREHLLAGNSGKAVTAFVSIMQGCNQHCTFCIVPSTRGAERSRTIDDIVSECRGLVGRGVREVTLLGQIVTSFGKREIPVKDGKSAFVQLVEAVHAIDGLERVRFTSPHPKGYGDDLVEAYGRLPKLVECAHLPVQSGSDRMLKLMHRGYSRERYLGIIEKLRRVQPGMGLTTDIIVGFPGETEADFEDTLSLAREVGFDQAFVFKYSQRKDTPAAAMPDQLPEDLIEDLVNDLVLFGRGDGQVTGMHGRGETLPQLGL